MNAVHPHLAAANEREAIGKLAVVFAKRSDLGASELNAGFEGFHDFVLVKRFAVLGYRFRLAFHV